MTELIGTFMGVPVHATRPESSTDKEWTAWKKTFTSFFQPYSSKEEIRLPLTEDLLDEYGY